MTARLFWNFASEVHRLYDNAEYARALELIDQRGPAFPEHTYFITLWRISLLSRMGERDSALDVLAGSVAAGGWPGMGAPVAQVNGDRGPRPLRVE